MKTRNILIAAAISVLAATPMLAQQKTVPASRTVATVARDTTARAHRSLKARTMKADSTTKKTTVAAVPSTDSTKTAKHHAKKHVRHSTKKTATKP